MTADSLNHTALIAGAVLTLMVFSYLLGDNFLYRIAVSILVGAAAAFVLIVAIESVVIPWINLTMTNPLGAPVTFIIGLLPFLISLFLLLKTASGNISRVGNIGIAIMVGVGTAIALWGAINGTLYPLATDTARDLRPAGSVVDGVIVLVGTITVLISFTYLGTRRPNGQVVQVFFARLFGGLGRLFIVVTLGATYALLIISALTVLTGVISQRLLVLKP